MSVTRQVLFEEVWKEPMTTVAKRYDVSSSFLARVCERLNVPRPCRGYWAKLPYGKAPPKPELPAALPGDEIAWSKGTALPPFHPPVPRAPDPDQKPMRRRRANRPSRHALVTGAEAGFAKTRETETGFLRPRASLMADIFVSRLVLARALDVANELYLALEDRGHRVVISPKGQFVGRPCIVPGKEGDYEYRTRDTWSPRRPTLAFFGTVAVGLTLYETTELAEVVSAGLWTYVRADKAPRKPPSYGGYTPPKITKDMPDGRLCLRAFLPYRMTSWRKEWREVHAGSMPGKIRSIIQELEDAAPALVTLIEEGERKAQEMEAQWKVEQLERERQMAIRERKQATEESRKLLFAAIEDWALAKKIEGFLEDAERRAVGLPDPEREQMIDRLKLARSLIGEVDALRHLRSWPSPEECLAAAAVRSWY